MNNIPCYCDNCHYLFGLRNNLFAGNLNIVMENSFTNCPRCQKNAFILNGHYKLYNDVLKMANGLTLDEHTKSQLKMILGRAINDEPLTQSDLDFVSTINPQLSELIIKFFDADMPKKLQIIGFLVIMFAFYPSLDNIIDPSLDMLGERLKVSVEEKLFSEDKKTNDEH